MSASVLKLIYKLRSEVILNYGKELWFTQIMFNILKQLGIITANDAQDTAPPAPPSLPIPVAKFGPKWAIYTQGQWIEPKSTTPVVPINEIAVSKSAFFDNPTWRVV